MEKLPCSRSPDNVGRYSFTAAMLKPQRNAVRDLVSLDGFWSFRRDPNGSGEAAGWMAGFESEQELAVPGSWNEQCSDLRHFFGLGWYQTRFFVPASWMGRGVRLRVGAAQRHAKVWLNGEFMGSHHGGSLPFDLDLEASLIMGEANLLVIAVDGGLDPWDLPPAQLMGNEAREGFHNSNPSVTYDFFPYAGLSRSVVLQITPERTRIEAVSVRNDLADGRATVVIEAVVCEAPQAKADAISLEADIEGVVRRAPVDADGRARLSFEIARPRLWDVGVPELYEARLRLVRGTEVIDAYCQSFGIRTVRVEGDRFLINGRPVFFRGFGKHEDFAIAGRGFYPPLVVRDFDLLRWIGANSFRTSHYPYAEEWYEFADRHGILVIGETPLVGMNSRMYVPEVKVRASALLGEMIARDRNHPSVVMWSLANEPNIDTPEGEKFFRELAAEARALDATRPITYVAHREPENNRPLDAVDVVSINKYYGWYERPGDIAGSLDEFGACLDRFRRAFGKPVLVAEFGADAVPGLHTMEPAEMFSEEYQAEIIVAQLRELERRPWVIGAHVWAFADFKTAQSITRVVFNHKGVFTRDRQPKLAAHKLRELWHGRREKTASAGLNAMRPRSCDDSSAREANSFAANTPR